MQKRPCLAATLWTFLVLATASLWTAPAEAQSAIVPVDARAPDTMEARVLACTSCHGLQGQGTGNDYFPRLAGKPSGYLYNQLVAFRDGRRRYPPMNYLLEFLPDPYLKQMAEYFAAQRPPGQPPIAITASQETLAHGRALVTAGAVDRGIPACSGCHGPALAGMEPAIPGLIGLKPAYISAQLGAWRYGTRTAAAPDCMQMVASRLTENDVISVAAFLSSLAVPADPTPAPRATASMQLPCGSEPN